VQPGNVSANHTFISNDLAGWNDDVLLGINPEDTITTPTRIACVHQDVTSQVRTIVTHTANAVVSTVYHVAVTSDGTTLRLYVNGVESDSAAKAGTALTWGNNAINLGQNPNISRLFTGKEDDQALFNYTLSASQINNLYALGTL
jgi:hypothetical protein